MKTDTSNIITLAICSFSLSTLLDVNIDLIHIVKFCTTNQSLWLKSIPVKLKEDFFLTRDLVVDAKRVDDM